MVQSGAGLLSVKSEAPEVYSENVEDNLNGDNEAQIPDQSEIVGEPGKTLSSRPNSTPVDREGAFAEAQLHSTDPSTRAHTSTMDDATEDKSLPDPDHHSYSQTTAEAQIDPGQIYEASYTDADEDGLNEHAGVEEEVQLTGEEIQNPTSSNDLEPRESDATAGGQTGLDRPHSITATDLSRDLGPAKYGAGASGHGSEEPQDNHGEIDYAVVESPAAPYDGGRGAVGSPTVIGNADQPGDSGYSEYDLNGTEAVAPKLEHDTNDTLGTDMFEDAGNQISWTAEPEDEITYDETEEYTAGHTAEDDVHVDFDKDEPVDEPHQVFNGTTMDPVPATNGPNTEAEDPPGGLDDGLLDEIDFEEDEADAKYEAAVPVSQSPASLKRSHEQVDLPEDGAEANGGTYNSSGTLYRLPLTFRFLAAKKLRAD